MQKGKIDVTTDNIFPIIKKFLYSDHEIFLRELISNAVDASQKLKTLASLGDFKGEMGDLTIRVSLDKEAGTLTVSDRGIGMTAEEVEKYINQIAFSSAGDFLDKYKDKIDAIIGHFGLGFYSSFMVSKQVDIITKSHKEDAKAVKWSCEGTPEFTLEEVEKDDRGTDIVLHIDEESKEFLEPNRIEELLNKYCKFLPIKIAFGKEQEWKDEKYVDTDKDKIINNTQPAWTRKPTDLTDEDYNNFYRELYPASETPLFNIHLNVDYPFNLTGILYFPRIKSNIEIQRNKIQLYCNQVFVTDSVEGIVPEFLTLLHGVIDSPDIPLNVSRSYLQSDSNVKKISNHINKKVADRLFEIFKNDRQEFEKKWEDLKLFITYGMISDEKFYERAKKFSLLKNTDKKYFTFEEYEKLIGENQKNKDGKVVYLYATDAEAQYTFIENARAKGYDVLLMDGQLDAHFINHLETKLPDAQFARVDADVIDKLIEKEDAEAVNLPQEQQNELRPVIESQLPQKGTYFVSYANLSKDELPMIITQSEFMRRMKDMSALSGESYMSQMPDSYNLVVNVNHPLVEKIIAEKDEKLKAKIDEIEQKRQPLQEQINKLEEAQKDKKDEEIPQADKDRLSELNQQVGDIDNEKDTLLKDFGRNNSFIKQMVDLALLSNNMLKGEALTNFVKRSVQFIEK